MAYLRYFIARARDNFSVNDDYEQHRLALSGGYSEYRPEDDRNPKLVTGWTTSEQSWEIFHIPKIRKWVSAKESPPFESYTQRGLILRKITIVGSVVIVTLSIPITSVLILVCCRA